MKTLHLTLKKKWFDMILSGDVGIERGKAKPEWSDNWQGDVFIIKLGNVISKTK